MSQGTESGINKKISGFVKLGFRLKGISGNNQAYGSCPFCGKDDDLYINLDNKLWDCKVCGEGGNYIQFINKCIVLYSKYFRGACAKRLKRLRGIKIKTFKQYGVGYIPSTKQYILSSYNEGKLMHVMLYDGKKLIGLAGLKSYLYGLQFMHRHNKTIWLVEGHWDTMALDEALRREERYNECAIGVPGADVFKADWRYLFKGKDVKVVYDADKWKLRNGVWCNAAVSGMHKVGTALKDYAKSIKFIHWERSLKDGYDIRDFYKERVEDLTFFFEYLEKNLKSKPPKLKKGSDAKYDFTKEKEKTVIKLSNNEPPDVHTVKSIYSKYLLIKDERVIDLLFGTVLANRLAGDPIWLFLVAPSGGAKSEYLMSLSMAPLVYTVTTLTPAALISGSNLTGLQDPSLIPQLDGKVLIIKDFTTILSMNVAAREEIFGTLRDAYDGKIEKQFGNNVIRKYESKFGIIAGVTPIIEAYSEEHTALGERFLRYRIPNFTGIVGQTALLKKAMNNTLEHDTMRDDMNKIACKVLDYDYKNVPSMSENIQKKILYLAQITARIRGTVLRDKYSKEIVYKPFSEYGTRLAKQLYKLALGIAIFNRHNVVDEYEYEIVKGVALGTMPSKPEDILKLLYRKKGGEFSAQEISAIVGLPTITCQRTLENMRSLGVVKRKTYSSIMVRYVLTKAARLLCRESKLYRRKVIENDKES